jgi:hypothetical protein
MHYLYRAIGVTVRSTNDRTQSDGKTGREQKDEEEAP